MNHETPEELLHRLVAACDEGNHEAILLAQHTDIEALRALLQESARQYRRAADELRTVCEDDRIPASGQRHGAAAADLPVDGDIVSSWERAECEALTCFRDAFDMPLRSDVADTVKRHYEAGLSRLERLRKLQNGV